MKKAVILGTENMHAISFAEALLDGYLPGVELIGAYGEYEDANDVFRRMGVRLARDPADFVGEADVALATARHGDKHFEHVLPYAEAGAILWIDKPFCVSKDKAHALIETAKKSGSLVAGGSFMPFAPAFARLAESLKNRPADRPLLGGSVVCPVRMEEEFGGFFFYTQHLVEIVLSVFGKDVRSVWASRNGVNVSAVCRYDGFDVSCLWHEGGFHYDACVCYPDGSEFAHVTPEEVGRLHYAELDDVARMIETGKQPRSYAEMMLPLDILWAMYGSLCDGRFHPVVRDEW